MLPSDSQSFLRELDKKLWTARRYQARLKE
jgi:hypothetical protein